MDFPTISPLKRELLNKATQTYYEGLKGSPETQEYLKGRGITGEVARQFRLGFVLDPLENHSEMQGMLSIPYITPLGTVAIRFRRLSGEGGKYHQEAGSFTPLFNVRDLHRSEPYLVVNEGELDTVVMSGLCGVPAVGLAGTGQWTHRGKFYRRLFLDYERVFVVQDPDSAGQKIVPDILKKVPNAINIVLPADVNDTFLEYGREYILKEMGLWEKYASLEMPLSA
jgi:5S rRNA maturation endonuclease (ribonuclease M5)